MFIYKGVKINITGVFQELQGKSVLLFTFLNKYRNIFVTTFVISTDSCCTFLLQPLSWEGGIGIIVLDIFDLFSIQFCLDSLSVPPLLHRLLRLYPKKNANCQQVKLQNISKVKAVQFIIIFQRIHETLTLCYFILMTIIVKRPSCATYSHYNLKITLWFVILYSS